MGWRKVGRKLLFPPIWLMGLLTAASALLLTAVFVKGWEQRWFAYGVYVLAFYTVSVVTAYLVMVLPKRYGLIKQRLYETALGNRYMTDRAFRGGVIASCPGHQPFVCGDEYLVLAFQPKLVVCGAGGILFHHGGDAVFAGALCTKA